MRSAHRELCGSDKLIDGGFAGDENARTAFDSAGIVEEMGQLMESASAPVSVALRDGTIHIGE